MPLSFSLPELANSLEACLASEADRLDLEQSVRGLDALDELGLHPLLQAGLLEAGYGVYAEQRYPAATPRRRESEGERCDLVLTPGALELAVPGREPTLFDPPDAVALEEALWLEVKVVGQYTPEGANPRYASHLLGDVRRDVQKLSRDPGITSAALLIVLFAGDEEVAAHDLTAWLTRCLDQDLPIGSPCLRSFSINDRLGNGVCVVGVYPVWHEERLEA